jgi:hypothetical protein
MRCTPVAVTVSSLAPEFAPPPAGSNGLGLAAVPVSPVVVGVVAVAVPVAAHALVAGVVLVWSHELCVVVVVVSVRPVEVGVVVDRVVVVLPPRPGTPPVPLLPVPVPDVAHEVPVWSHELGVVVVSVWSVEVVVVVGPMLGRAGPGPPPEPEPEDAHVVDAVWSQALVVLD